MKVYLDLIMILNFAIDFILLLSVSLMLKRNVSIYRIMLGSFIGGISILFLFFNMNSILLFLFKLIISIFMILITFGYKTIKYTLINLLYLYMSSIILGGFLYLLNLEFSYKNIGIIFFNNGLSINFIFLLIVSPIILYIYIKQTKSLKYNYSNYY
ncbi:MAG: sigma-E processing peptidase SpoIIGA, partial [bacterium]|nr:sigma-E processing peptidase SpoIIGA [bacterium]